MGTKQNPGEFDCHGAAADDEPIFTLRATDPTAPFLVRLWAAHYAERNEPFDERQRKKFDEAIACAKDMELWRLENPAIK